MRRTTIHLLFWLSGAAGLIYQVAWMRKLALVLGVTSQAVATVLAVFMAGLALGSWLLGRAGDESRSPLRFYGWLELGIALFGLQSILLLDGLLPHYLELRRSGAIPVGLLPAVPVLLASLALLGPTALMGATLPVLIQAVRPGAEHLGRASGRLYAVNTLGAVCGVLASAFFLIEHLGLRGSILVAAAANALAGVLALFLASRERNAPLPHALPGSAPDARSVLRPPGARVVLAAFGASGFLALAYEVLWTRYLVYVVGENSVYAFSAMLAAFLLGIALGSWLASWVADRLRNPALLFGIVLVLMGAAALGTISAMGLLLPERGAVESESYWLATAARFFRCLLVLLPPATLSGATFALVTKVYATDAEHVGNDVGRAYAVNTLGAILGALAGGFLVLPRFGLRMGLAALAAANVLVGIAVLLRHAKGARAGAAALAAVLVAALAAWTALVAENPAKAFLNTGDEQLVFYEDGPESSIAIVRSNRTGDKYLLVDGDGQAGTWPRMQIHLRLLGHLPAFFHPAPKDGLVVAFGAGFTTGCLAQHPLERVDVVELSGAVLRGAEHFAPWNHDPLHDPKVNVIRDDGRNYLLRTDSAYDIITSDPIDPDDAGVTSLYAHEYYELVRAHLREGGVACQWMTTQYEADEYRMLVRTFQSVFPNASIWYGDYTTVLVGLKGNPRVGMEELRERMEIPAVRASLEPIGIPDAESLVALLLAGPEAVRSFVGDGPLNTDDRPLIEYLGPRWGERENQSQSLWKPLIQLRSPDLGAWIADWTEEDRAACADDRSWANAVLERLLLEDRVVVSATSSAIGDDSEDDPRAALLHASEQREAESERYLELTWQLLGRSGPRIARMLAGLDAPEPGADATAEQVLQYERGLEAGLIAWEREDWEPARVAFQQAAEIGSDARRPAVLAAACSQRLGRPIDALRSLLHVDTEGEATFSDVRWFAHAMMDCVLAEMARPESDPLAMGRELLSLTPPEEERPEPSSLAREIHAGEPDVDVSRPGEAEAGDVERWRLWWHAHRAYLEPERGRFTWSPLAR